MSDVTDKILEVVDNTFHPWKIIYGYIPKEYSRNSINVTLKRMEKRGYIQRGMMEDEICLKLTESGMEWQKAKAQAKKERNLFNIKPTQQKRDGLWRVVIFDIPEENKRIRQALRNTLKILGFQPLQKSVWVSKNNYTKQLELLIKKLNLQKFILILETKHLGN